MYSSSFYTALHWKTKAINPGGWGRAPFILNSGMSLTTVPILSQKMCLSTFSVSCYRDVPRICQAGLYRHGKDLYLYPKIMYKLPKFDYSSILQRTEAYCSRHRTELTLSYALWLTGIDDAEEIYANSVRYFHLLRDTYPSYLQYRHNTYFAELHYQEFVDDTDAMDPPDPEMLQDMQDYFDGLFSRLSELRDGFGISMEEQIGSGWHLRRWVYEQR